MTTLFYTLAGRGDEAALQAWMDESGKRGEHLVDRPDPYGLTALHWAAQSGRLTTMCLLIERYHAAPTIVTTYERFTLLHSAVQSGVLPCVQYALEALTAASSADSIMARNNAHLTATQLAEKLGHTELHAFLLARSPRSGEATCPTASLLSAEPSVTIVRAQSSMSPTHASTSASSSPSMRVPVCVSVVPTVADEESAPVLQHARVCSATPGSVSPLLARERALVEREAEVARREREVHEREERVQAAEARIREQALRLKKLMAEHH
jgi:ankyrin repeat protein